MSQTEKRIAIMQAAVAGEAIEYLDLKRVTRGWRDYPKGSCPEWAWLTFDYRVKAPASVGDVFISKAPAFFEEGAAVQVVYVKPEGKGFAYLCVANTPEEIKKHAGATDNMGEGIWYLRKGEFTFSEEPAAVAPPEPEFEWVNIYGDAPKTGIYRGIWGAPHDTEARAISSATVAATGKFSSDYLGTLKVTVRQ